MNLDAERRRERVMQVRLAFPSRMPPRAVFQWLFVVPRACR